MSKMQLLSLGDYKSLSSSSINIEVPNFTLVTGTNGAGKTQLLEALANGSISTNVNGEKINLGTIWNNENVKLNNLENYSISSIEHTFYTRGQQRIRSADSIYNFKSFYDNIYLKNDPHAVDVTLSQYGGVDYYKDLFRRTVERAASSLQKDVHKLNERDLENFYNLRNDLNQVNLLQQNFGFRFVSYIRLLEQNDYAQLRNEKHADFSYTYLDEDSFVKAYGPSPWIYVNEALVKIGLRYQITKPITNVDRNTSQDLRFYDTDNPDITITIDDLSSGEKILMAILFASYNAQMLNADPQYLLLDELDAFLHPSMIDQFIRTVNDVLVKDKGFRVIATTHSPTTVALSPEESIYVMNRTGDRITKSTKDQALKILTSGLNTFSVNYENRKQVFVEGVTDVPFYEKVYNKLSSHLISDISLNFIRAGFGTTGNCQQVIDIVNKLNDYGNKNIYGVIDWDSIERKVLSNNIKISGYQRRYSLENYILDPLIMIAFIIHARKIEHAILGVSDDTLYVDVKEFDETKIQQVCDRFLDFVHPTIKASPKYNNHKEEALLCRYVNQKSVYIPKWYLYHPGHDLEDCLVKIFPTFNAFNGKNYEGLKQAVVDTIINDLPTIVPEDILILLRAIQLD